MCVVSFAHNKRQNSIFMSMYHKETRYPSGSMLCVSSRTRNLSLSLALAGIASFFSFIRESKSETETNFIH